MLCRMPAAARSTSSWRVLREGLVVGASAFALLSVLGLQCGGGGPAAPTLSASQVCGTANPCPIEGSGQPGLTIALVINGEIQKAHDFGVVEADGSFELLAILLDGTNTISAVQRSGSGSWSALSNQIEVSYANDIDRGSLPSSISGFTVWTAGTGEPYTYPSADLTVAPGARLVIQPGAVVRFGSNRSLRVNGRLELHGTAAEPAVLTSSQATPTRGSWRGVVVDYTAHASFTSGLIEFAQTGISMSNPLQGGLVQGSLEVLSTRIREFSVAGIDLFRVANATVIGSEIDNAAGPRAGRGIELENASALVSLNLVRGVQRGIYVFGCFGAGGYTGSVVGENEIVQTDYGIYLYNSRGCTPSIHFNRIHQNGWNLYTEAYGSTGGELVVDAERNYWGSNVLADVLATIRDRSDNSNNASDPGLPYVDVIPASDQDGQLLAWEGLLSGPLWTKSGLTPGSSYQVVGSVGVPSGDGFTFPENVTLSFPGNSWLRLDGPLRGPAAGDRTQLVGASGTRGFWRGLIATPQVAAHVERLEIAHAANGVLQHSGVADSSLRIVDARIREFSVRGVSARYRQVEIEESEIDNSAGPLQGECVGVYWSTVQIRGALLRGCTRGLFVERGAVTYPVSVSEGSEIFGNGSGIVVDAGGTTGPRPTVTSTDLYGNPSGNLVFLNFAFLNGSPVPISATRNWWGSTNPADILAGIVVSVLPGDEPPVRVDFSEPLASPGGSPQLGLPYFSYAFSGVSFDPPSRIFSPPSQVGRVDFTIGAPATVTMSICTEGVDDGCASPVRTYTQVYSSPGAKSIVWDGRRGDGSFAPDDAYVVRLIAEGGPGGVNGGVFDKARGTPGGSGGSAGDPGLVSYNPHRNIFWKIPNLTIQYFGGKSTAVRSRLKIMAPGVACQLANPATAGFYIPDNRPIRYDEPPQLLQWDGRDPAGNILGQRAYCSEYPIEVKPNHFIVRGTKPTIRGDGMPATGSDPGFAPSVEVKANPYRIRHSYEQQARMVFRVDHDATVTIRLLPPGTVDPGHSLGFLRGSDGIAWSARSASANLDYAADWWGYEAPDTNVILLGEDGLHTFLIEATSQTTGLTTSYRGVLQALR